MPDGQQWTLFLKNAELAELSPLHSYSTPEKLFEVAADGQLPPEAQTDLLVASASKGAALADPFNSFRLVNFSIEL